MITYRKAFTRYSINSFYNFKNETYTLVVVGILCGRSKCWGDKPTWCVFLYGQ